uniref:Uncharacterized protein n=1 Tax=Emiliania huxleyi TaxID=2903 RepID=A0A6V2VZF5_EMIHU
MRRARSCCAARYWGQPAASEQWLCAGYVAVEAGGALNMSLAGDGTRRGVIFLKDNGRASPVFGARALGGLNGVIDIRGRPLRRTWSLLARPADSAAASITLLHDPLAMGWAVGDRIALAPTTAGSSGEADARRIAGFGAGNTVTLDAPLSHARSDARQRRAAIGGGGHRTVNELACGESGIVHGAKCIAVLNGVA